MTRIKDQVRNLQSGERLGDGKKRFYVGFLATLCCFLWGSAFPVLKLSYKYFDIIEATPWTYIGYAGLRFLLAGLILLAIFYRRIGGPRLNEVSSYVIISLFQTVFQYGFFYLGIAHTTGTKASIIAGANVFIALLLSSLIFKYESLTLKKILGCIMGFVGIVLVNSSGLSKGIQMAFLGEGLILMANTSYAFSTNFMKGYAQKFDPVRIATYQFLIGGMVMVAFGAILGDPIALDNTDGILALGYLGVVSAFAYALWSLLLKSYPVSVIAVYGFTTPIFGAITSRILLNENALLESPFILISLGLVSGGILLVTSQNRKG